MDDRSRLEAVLADAGFVDVRSEIIELATPFASPDEYVEYLRDTSVTINNLLTEQSLDRRADVWKAIRTAIAVESRSAGSFVELSTRSPLPAGAASRWSQLRELFYASPFALLSSPFE